MSKESNESRALVQISDILGLSRGLEMLAQAIERGAGQVFAPWQRKRIAKAEIANYENWTRALERTGLAPKAAELSLSDRASVRVVADDIRRQDNREAIAAEAIADVRQAIESKIELISSPVDIEWIDRFWRLAQDVTDSDMQAVWGRILARRTTGVESYSARCLETVSLLSRDEISKLERLATLLLSTKISGTNSYSIVNSVRWKSKALPKEIDARLRTAAGEMHREIFGPAGIALDSGSGWAHTILMDASESSAEFSLANRHYVLRFPDSVEGVQSIGAGLGISPLGAEIFSLIKVEPDPSYLSALEDALKYCGIEMSEI
jgi:hypothetical protein